MHILKNNKEDNNIDGFKKGFLLRMNQLNGRMRLYNEIRILSESFIEGPAHNDLLETDEDY